MSGGASSVSILAHLGGFLIPDSAIYLPLFVALQTSSDPEWIYDHVRHALRTDFGNEARDLEAARLKSVVRDPHYYTYIAEHFGINIINKRLRKVPQVSWDEIPSEAHLLYAILKNIKSTRNLYALTITSGLNLLEYGYRDVASVSEKLVEELCNKYEINLNYESVDRRDRKSVSTNRPNSRKKPTKPLEQLYEIPKPPRLVSEESLAAIISKALTSSKDWSDLLPKVRRLLIEEGYGTNSYPEPHHLKIVAARFNIDIESELSKNRPDFNPANFADYKVDYTEKWIHGGSLTDGQTFESWGQLTNVCHKYLISHPDASLHFGTKEGKSLATILKGYFLVYIPSPDEWTRNPYLPLEKLNLNSLSLESVSRGPIYLGLSQSWIQIPRSLIYLIRYDHFNLPPSEIVLRVTGVSPAYLDSEIESLERRHSDSGLRIAKAAKGFCVICGHGLSDDISLERGVGPDCWRNLTPEQKSIVRKIYDFRVSVEEALPSKMLSNIQIKKQISQSIQELFEFYPN